MFETEQSTYWQNCIFLDPTAYPGFNSVSNDVKPWSLEATSDRGFIAIANKSFKTGDFILAESPCTFVIG